MANKAKHIFIPSVTIADLKFTYELLKEQFTSLFHIIFLLAWRCQLTTTFLQLNLSYAEIQQLDSAKVNSRLIYSLGKPLAAAIAVTRTLGFEASTLKSKDEEGQISYLREIVRDLINSDSPPGVRIYRVNQLNAETINLHRHGIMASLIGSWQSKPIFETSSVISGIPAGTITPSDTIEISIALSDLIQKDADTWNYKEINTDSVIQDIVNKLENKTFNDGIYISSSNILPMEEGLTIKRSIPSVFPAIEVDPNSTNEILNTAISQANELANSNKKVKTVRPTTPQPPKVDGSDSKSVSVKTASKKAPSKAAAKAKKAQPDTTTESALLSVLPPLSPRTRWASMGQ
jgi:hypothetical protein